MKKSIALAVIALTISSVSMAQIPNNGFESWTNMGSYSNPDNWSTLNDMTAQFGVYTCTKGTPGNPGTSYMKLTSKSVLGMGVIGGIAICGTIDTLSMQPIGGFPFTNRPANFTGSWQHMIFGSSQGYIDVTLTYWDAGMQMRMPVASAHQTLSGMAMNWANFTMPLTYVSALAPDSCIIVLSASGSTPAANDYLWVDNLNFSGTVTGVSEINAVADVKLSPNPAQHQLVIDISGTGAQPVTMEVYNLIGKQMISPTSLFAGEKNVLDVSGFPAGSYLMKITSDDHELTRTFVKE